MGKNKKIAKIFKVTTSSVLIASIVAVLYAGMITMVYSIKYQGKEVGQVSSEQNPEREIIKVDNQINSVAADGYVPVKNNIQVSEKFVFAADNNTGTINAKSVIDADSNLNTGYGIKLNNNYVVWDKSKEALKTYLSDFQEYINSNYTDEKIDILEFCIIEPCVYTDSNLKEYKDLMNDLGLALSKTEYKEIIREEDIPAVFIYGNEEKQIREGTKALIKEIYEIKITNDSETSSEKISEETINKGTSAIYSTPDKTKLTYKTETVNLASWQLDFINTILPILIDGQEKYHIPVSLGLGQAIHESGWGIYNSNNNIYGIKGANGYKAYNSFEESSRDYINLLATKKNYAKILTANSYIEACEYIGASGYAGNPTYGQSIKNTIEKYQLYLWDNL